MLRITDELSKDTFYAHLNVLRMGNVSYLTSLFICLYLHPYKKNYKKSPNGVRTIISYGIAYGN